MPKLSSSDIKAINKIFEMREGYLLDFTNKTFSEFFDDELNIDVEDAKYLFNGESKAKRLRAFIEVEDGYLVARALRALWDYKCRDSGKDEDEEVKILDIISRLQSGVSTQVLTALTSKIEVLSMDTVSRDLDRALESAFKDPESAVTSACSTLESLCRSILVELDIELPKKRDIKTLYDAVKKPLRLSPGHVESNTEIADDVRKVLSGLATVVEGIGALRTHGGDSHGRERGFKRLDVRIAKLAIHSASTVALFLIETWQLRFPNKTIKKS